MYRGAQVAAQYVFVSACALGSLLAGASAVHWVTRPDLSLDLEAAAAKRRAQQQQEAPPSQQQQQQQQLAPQQSKQ
jgi:hypothetical protein